MTRALLAALAVALLAAGCDVDDYFHCLDDAQCGEGGVCEANNACSFEDEDCGSGRRYGELAPTGIANVCVPVGETLSPVAEPVEDEPAPESVCGREDTCDACLTCTLFDGPCAAGIWSCTAEDACLDGVTCGQTCLLTGICDDCCAGASASEVDRIEANMACIVSECAALCGEPFEPVCAG